MYVVKKKRIKRGPLWRASFPFALFHRSSPNPRGRDTRLTYPGGIEGRVKRHTSKQHEIECGELTANSVDVSRSFVLPLPAPPPLARLEVVTL